MQVVWDNLPEILDGLRLTIGFSLAGIILALIIGLMAALMRLSGSSILRGAAAVYVEIFRSTPLLVQLFFIVLGLPGILPLNNWVGPELYPLVGAALTLALHEGAYVTEIIRSGILGVDQGQKEAAAAIGMTSFKTMRYIVLPQAFRQMIPPLVNQSAQTIKDTSLLAPIGIADMVFKGQMVIAETFSSFQIWSAIGIIYFIIIYGVSWLASYLEMEVK